MSRDGAAGAVARRVADETGVCPACGATPTTIDLTDSLNAVGLFFPHERGCPAVAGVHPDAAVVTAVKAEADAVGWERDQIERDLG